MLYLDFDASLPRDGILVREKIRTCAVGTPTRALKLLLRAFILLAAMVPEIPAAAEPLPRSVQTRRGAWSSGQRLCPR